MTRSEARKIGKQMLKAGFRFVRLIEDLDTGIVTLEALNQCWMTRTVACQADWDALKMEG